ncbi:MAG: fibronectin type III domain-containing protein [Bacteroides sp.]|nr:fibronectin type III domain-containing protein [Bacteroides sp.]
MNRRYIFSLLGVAAVCLPAGAQEVLGYSVSEKQGTYTALEGATVVYDSSMELANTSVARNVFTPGGVVTDSGEAQGYSIGFDVTMCGSTFKNFLVGAPGYVMLGNGEMEYNASMEFRWMTYMGDYTVTGFGNRFNYEYTDATKVSYKVLGTGDAQRLVVQFEQIGMDASFWGDCVPVDVQVSLYGNGNVEVTFNDISGFGGDDLPLYLGVRHNGNYICASGSYGALGVSLNSQVDSKYPSTLAAGSTVVWTAPGACVMPEHQPTALELSSTSDAISGEFTPSDDAESYLVVYAKGGAELPAPADGSVYAKGDAYGDGFVALASSDTNFKVSSLDGNTEYDFIVYAFNSRGSHGPVYNTANPLKGSVGTLPGGAKSVEVVSAVLDTIILNVESNDQDNDVVVLYTPYVERSTYGDHGLFGTIPADVKAGDVLEYPEDYENPYPMEGVAAPADGGRVAYVGKAGEITLDALDPSTEYYVGVYTRNESGANTSDPLYAVTSTIIEAPYDGDSYNFPRFGVPGGWQTSETDADNGILSFTDQYYYDRATQAPSQGTNLIQQMVRVNAGDAVNGRQAWLIPAPVKVNDRHLIARFDYCIMTYANRFAKDPYNDWAEGDVLSLQVSADNGATWTDLAAYDTESHPLEEESYSYVSIAADLNDYRGGDVLVRLYWKTCSVAAFGTEMFVDRFTVLQGEFPAVPEVSVGKVTDSSAVITWVSQQQDYQLECTADGSDVTSVVSVNGASSYTLEKLNPNTGYTVRVRGILVNEEGESDGYSEWSDAVTFTTADYPEVTAPENLSADIETLWSSDYVILTWDKVAEADSYEVAYRLSSVTEWTNVATESNMALISGLEVNSSYIWKVKAFCSHDRETAYSPQARFETPETSGVDTAEADNVTVAAVKGGLAIDGAVDCEVYSASGRLVMSAHSPSTRTECGLAAGIYVVKAGGKTFKVVVR